jgi:hypothetical protein
MGHVDVSDQLRNYYRFDHYMRKRKWWWSLAFWGIGVQFVNAYVVYCKVIEASGTSKRDWLSHYGFGKAVALEWIKDKADNMVARKRTFLTMEDEQEDEAGDTPRAVGVSSASKTRGDSANRRSSSRLKEKEVEPEAVRQSVRVTNGSLHPDGALNKRLQRDLFHWPRHAKQNQQCTLHCWASNVKLKDKVLRCTDCKVHFCVSCYQLFHMVPNLVEKKEQMGYSCKNNKKEQR